MARRYAILSIVLLAGYQSEGTNFLIKLKDGTMFLSHFQVKELELKTKEGDLKFAISDIKSIKQGKTGLSVKTTKSIVEGKIDQDLKFKAKHGTLTIKQEDIAAIVPAQKRVFVDDSVTAYWDFDQCEEIKLNSSKLETEDDNSVVKLDLSNHDTIEIPHSENISMKEEVVIEMRFKYSSKGIEGNWINLLRKGNRYNAANYEIWILPGGKNIQVDALFTKGQSIATQFKAVGLEADKWLHMVCMISTKKKEMEVYINGKMQEKSSKPVLGDTLQINDSSIYICKETYENKNTMWIDYLAISGKALEPEEIKELYESGNRVNSIKPPVSKEYNSILMTKSGERYAGKLDKYLEFESPFGDVKVSTAIIEKMTFFEYRKDEVDKLHKKARELIPKLGDDDPHVREKT